MGSSRAGVIHCIRRTRNTFSHPKGRELGLIAKELRRWGEAEMAGRGPERALTARNKMV